MSERLSDRFTKFLRRSFGLLSANNSSNTTSDDELQTTIDENDIQMSPIVSETVPTKRKVRTKESDVNLIDIDSLMAQKSLKQEEEDSVEVNYINIFAQKYGGDEPTEDSKCHLARKLLLRGDPIPDLNPLNLLTDEEIDLIVSRLRADQLLALLNSWPQLKTKVEEFLVSKRFFWFTTDLTKGRFASHEDCCDLCDRITDLDQSIRVKDNKSLAQVFNAFSRVTFVFSSVRCLRLFRFVINEESDQSIAEMCPNLLHLDLTECRITYFKKLSADHKNLKHLILPSTSINDFMFRQIVKNKKSLKTIVVNTTDITGRDLIVLPKGMETIDIRCCHQLFPNYLKTIFMNGFEFQQLRRLRIEVVFDDMTFAQMCCSFNNLILLELSAYNRENTRLFTSKGLKQISRLSKLRTLKFGFGVAVHPIPLMDLYIGCPLMSCFSIDGTDCIVQIKRTELCQSMILSRMADYWPLIRKLDFINVECIEKEAIDGFTRLEYLTHLNLTECSTVDDECLINNIKDMKRLNYLIVDKCHRITILTFDAIVEKARSMDTVLSASFFRCSFAVEYIKNNELPENLRLTSASTKAKRFMTFDGNRAKVFRSEDIHKQFNGY